jgi:hypothetical protein
MALIFRGPTQYQTDDGKDECVEAHVLFDDADVIKGLDRLAVDVHKDNVAAGWWTNLKEGTRHDMLETRNRGEMLMLCVTELDEAIDAHDQGARDDKLPQYLGLHVELADCAIRLLDLIGAEQRRAGKQPLVTYYHAYGAITVASAHVEFRQDWRGIEFAILRIIGALSKALDEGYRRERVALARFYLTLALFRIIALCAIEDIPLFEIIEAKREFNRTRADHKIENRMAEGGKKL